MADQAIPFSEGIRSAGKFCDLTPHAYNMRAIVATDMLPSMAPLHKADMHDKFLQKAKQSCTCSAGKKGPVDNKSQPFHSRSVWHACKRPPSCLPVASNSLCTDCSCSYRLTLTAVVLKCNPMWLHRCQGQLSRGVSGPCNCQVDCTRCQWHVDSL